ncbi:MAG: hypothetical protein RLZZ267_1274 [Bacillota bacterium]|jgi:hypothetical protein
MFRVLGFWTLVIGLGAMALGLKEMALLFFAQTAAFVFLGYMRLTERAYILIFWSYMLLFFLGFTYWTFFHMKMPLLS